MKGSSIPAANLSQTTNEVHSKETVLSGQPRGLPTKTLSNHLSVRQEIILATSDEDKLAYLFSCFQDETVELTKVLIVARDAKTVDLLHMSLGRDLGLKCSALTQERAQRDREIARKEFIRGITIVLITSFQLSKGLNWPRVETIYIRYALGVSRNTLRL